MTRPVRVRAAVVSAGAWSQHSHIPTLLGDEQVELLAVSTPDPAVRGRLAAGWPDLRVATDPDEVLALFPDLVIVSSPPATHEPQVIAALETGAHVLVEKPFAITVDSAERMVRAADRCGRGLLVGFSWSSAPVFTRAHAWLSELGSVEHVDATLAVNTRALLSGSTEGGWGGSAASDPATYTDVAVSGGGAGAVSMAHLLSIVLWLTGLRPTAVAALAFPPGRPIDLHLSVLARTAQGPTLSLNTTSAQPGAVQPVWQLGIYGPGGDVHIDSRADAAWVDAAPGAPERRFSAPGAGSVDQHFPTRAAIAVARGAAVPAALSGQLGRDVVAVTEAAYRAAATRQWEPVRW